jgi:hypothetical protein
MDEYIIAQYEEQVSTKVLAKHKHNRYVPTHSQ